MRIMTIVILCLLVSCTCVRAQESLFPSVPGWTLAVESRVYDANDLWDVIDGAADLYLEYGFVDLHTARYTAANNRDVKAELYRHKDGENAFGMYAAERNPQNTFIAIGTQGYQQTSVVNFVAGEFYIRLSSHQSDSASGRELLAIARAVEKQLHRTAAFPKALRLFPQQGMQKNSEQFVAQNFLGYSFLRSVYTVSYRDGAKAFIIAKQSAADADTLVRTYLSTIPGGNVARTGDGGYAIQDPNNGPVALAQEGAYVFGVLNCTDAAMKNDLLSQLKRSCAPH